MKLEKQYKIIASSGFGRPATLLVSVASKFTSNMFLEYRWESVDLKNYSKSIMDVMALGFRPGDRINIRVEGIDEYQALKSIEEHLNTLELTLE